MPSLTDRLRASLGQPIPGWPFAVKPSDRSSTRPSTLRPDAIITAAPPPLRVAITFGTLALAALVVGLSWVVLHLAPVLLVLVVALFLVGTLGPLVESLEARNVRRSHAIGMIFGAIFLAFAAVLALTIPSLIAEVDAFARNEPMIRARVVEVLARSRFTTPLADALRTLDYAVLARSSTTVALDASTQSVKTIAYLASAVFLALYIMLDRDRLRGGLYALVPRSHHLRLSRVMLNLEIIVGGYIRGQMLTSALMAAFTFALLLACRVKGALAIALVAGLADVLPYVGALISFGLALAAAASRGMGVMVVVFAGMLAYAEFESRFLIPRVYGTVLKLPSSAVLVALLVGGELMGITGALLALPVAAAIRMLVEELRIELPGEDIDDTEIREGDARAEHDYERRVEGVPAEEAAAIALEIVEGRAEHPEDPGNRPAIQDAT